MISFNLKIEGFFSKYSDFYQKPSYMVLKSKPKSKKYKKKTAFESIF